LPFTVSNATPARLAAKFLPMRSAAKVNARDFLNASRFVATVINPSGVAAIGESTICDFLPGFPHLAYPLGATCVATRLFTATATFR